MSDLDTIEKAFSSHCSGITRKCACGKDYYYDSAQEGWEAGEYERLCEDKNAIGLAYWVETLIIEGVEYCIDCDCWKVKASAIKKWLDNHSYAIAEYLTLEKQRKQSEANASPVVK